MSPVMPTPSLEEHRSTRADTLLREGEVALVGAGPGDPDLLTIKAVRMLESADIVFHDALVTNSILDLIPAGVERVYVGKRKSEHAVPQNEIIERMIASARRGLRVVRLKGGDPFIFGRGGEEVDGLEAAEIPVTVVPGISSALGCAASARIPLTHRDCAQSVSFITGYTKGGDSNINWSNHASENETLVIFMGVGASERIARQLIDAGRSASTPVAVIENGTRPDERVLRSTLVGLEALVADSNVTGPALLIIGEVARKSSEQLNTLIAEVAA